jgi:hypothetical protein
MLVRRSARRANYDPEGPGVRAVTIDPGKVEAFSRLVTSLPASSETPALKAYLRAIPGKVVVGNKTIRIVGSKDVLADAAIAKKAARDNIRSSVPKWRVKLPSSRRKLPIIQPRIWQRRRQINLGARPLRVLPSPRLNRGRTRKPSQGRRYLRASRPA